MPFAFFRLPCDASPDLAGDLNLFLRSHRIVTVARQWMEAGRDSAWAFCVEYVEGGVASRSGGQGTAKVDYKEVLTPEQFEIFARLRTLRKTLCEREGVPVFAVFTNEQLAEIAQRNPATLADLKEVPGLGDQRAAKYGAEVLAVVNARG